MLCRTACASSTGRRSSAILPEVIARHVQEVVDQVGEVGVLARDDLARPAGGLRRRARDAEHGHGIGDGGQWVAQLVAEHGQELVLASARRLRLGAGGVLAGEKAGLLHGHRGVMSERDEQGLVSGGERAPNEVVGVDHAPPRSPPSRSAPPCTRRCRRPGRWAGSGLPGTAGRRGCRPCGWAPRRPRRGRRYPCPARSRSRAPSPSGSASSVGGRAARRRRRWRSASCRPARARAPPRRPCEGRCRDPATR